MPIVNYERVKNVFIYLLSYNERDTCIYCMTYVHFPKLKPVYEDIWRCPYKHLLQLANTGQISAISKLYLK